MNRHITYPRHACAYKVSEIKIKELRQRTEKASLELAVFHEVVLLASSPPPPPPLFDFGR